MKKEDQEKTKDKPLVDIVTKKEIAKIGMTVSMGLTVLSAFNLRSRFSKNLHIISGAALVGFSFYHNSLYDKSEKKPTSIKK
ncbi:hypothetical protein [Campylobacter blaseri]|uniref:Helicase n=1 Tax=Campylobacter blaseri TaxID=2042961 RepID=A0A2P8QYY7_9BACT|nr:hypothetical protein [Campylobacter blaseri]PSM51463.1 hypothetical protein CQ405_07795 [Campylobacter blaseri]PSM52912.1 hypothetical protein CRN67_07800 [Campylobacter blaseri]